MVDATCDLRDAADSEQRFPVGVGRVKPVLQSVLVRFEREGVEIAVSYSHREPAQPNPGTKTRTRRAARMARAGLQAALEGLDRGDALWGGFGTNVNESTDRVLVGGDPSSFADNAYPDDLRGKQKKGAATVPARHALGLAHCLRGDLRGSVPFDGGSLGSLLGGRGLRQRLGGLMTP